ncbi:uncharacterized protein LOC108094731 [Drosophila ficusphila]|uniref:uncharacterized protein LOC108094731 n=1 Tax=Drosophila ficusphila TaxID=30025 RepID=UPI001C8AF8E4|nr:uncharacterized protein LOC108094731 [Drosophila ficusphila]
MEIKPERIGDQAVPFEKRMKPYETPTLIAQKSLLPLAQKPVVVKKIKTIRSKEYEKKHQEENEAQYIGTNNIMMPYRHKQSEPKIAIQKMEAKQERIGDQAVPFEKRIHLYNTPTLIAQRSLTPLAQKPATVDKIKPKTREEYEKKQNIIRPKMIKNKVQTTGGNVKLKPKGNESSGYLLTPAEYKSHQEILKKNPSTVNVEHNLLEQFYKDQHHTINWNTIKRLETAFGKYTKFRAKMKSQHPEPFGPMLQKEGSVVSEFHPTLKSTYDLHSTIPSSIIYGDNVYTYPLIQSKKPAQYTKSFDKMLRNKNKKIPELHPLLKSSNRLKVITSKDSIKLRKRKTTKVGSKFSWLSRHKIKYRQGRRTKLLKDLIKYSFVAKPELLPALKSRTQLMVRNKKNEGAGKMFGTDFAGLKKSQLKKEKDPNYGTRTSDTNGHKNVPKSKGSKKGPTMLFQKMLKGQEAAMPELKPILKSNYQLKVDKKPP